MNAREFYKKRLKEDCTLGSIELMEEYAEYKLNEVHLPDVIGFGSLKLKAEEKNIKQYKDGYDWADKNGFEESSAKYACKQLYQEMKEYYENIISGNKCENCKAWGNVCFPDNYPDYADPNTMKCYEAK